MRFRNLPLLAAVQLVALFVFASCIPQASSASSRALPQAAVAPLCKTLGTMSVSYGRKSKNVVLLQHFLNQNDNAGLAESGFFGKMTKAALASFQEEYANEILIPSGLTLGSGNYGRATKKKISTLCYEGGKGAAIKPIVSTSANPAIKNSVVSTSTAVFTPPVSVVHSGGSSGGGGGGGGGSSVTLDPVILFTSATGTVPFNGTTSISWSASNATDCHSSNSTSTSVTGSFITSALATTTAFSVTCNNGSKNATKQVMVNVIPDCVNCFKKRWVYFSLGDALSSSSSTSAYYQKFFEIVDRAKAAGYNGIAVNSSGSGDFETMLTATSSYFNTNMAAMRAKASSSGMELIPIGGSPNIPQYVEPSLVEAMPVNGTPFIVSGATATPVGAHIGVNDDFESGTTGWTFGDGLKLDATVAHSGTSSVMFTAASSTSRLIRSFSGLKPHTAYRVSLWVKSNNYDGYLRTRVYGIN